MIYYYLRSPDDDIFDGTRRADETTTTHSLGRKKYFSDKVVWVTGASSGIGEELSKQLSDAGAFVILSARREEKLRSVQNTLANPKASAVLVVDLGDLDALPSKVTQALALSPSKQIDVLVNNGGISSRAFAKDTSFAVHKQLMEVDYFAPVRLYQGLLGGWLEDSSKTFQIINVASISGKLGGPLRSGYSGVGRFRFAHLCGTHTHSYAGKIRHDGSL